METMGLSPTFWNGKRVLLTGHTGFKGSWLSLWLQSLGAQVSGFALAPATEPNLFELARVGEGMDDRRGDLRDLGALLELIAETEPEIVLHLAAQPLVREAYRDPLGTYSSNVMGTLNLLEAIRQVGGVSACVLVTTDKVYANQEWAWPYRENEALGGHDPYSSSKACCELLAQSYVASVFSARALRCPWPGRGDCAGRQCPWRRRLFAGATDSRCAARLVGERAGDLALSTGRAPLAACIGAAGGLSAIGRGAL